MASVELIFNSEQSRSAGYAVVEKLKTQLKLTDVGFTDEGFGPYPDYSISERRSGGEFDILRLWHIWDGLDYDCDAVVVADSRTFEQALKIVALGINGRRQGLSEKHISAFAKAVS